MSKYISVVFFVAIVVLWYSPARAQAALVVLDKANQPIAKLTDGDSIKLKATVAQVNQPTQVAFTLDDGARVSECTIAGGGMSCETASFATLGWAWSKDARPRATRTIKASIGDASATIQVSPRPVVMAHGFLSTAIAWENYLGANGFLAPFNIRGFAVGDGQVEGKFNTGSIDNPPGKTNTIAQNAEILKNYIAGVKKMTGAQQVDLIGHSMGGLISRYYIDRLMGDRDVAQLIMLGTPNGGSSCANLPVSLSFYLPASLEIRPSYYSEMFNRQITRRRGVSFSMVAGTQLSEPVQSPCTDVPSDVAVSLESAQAIAIKLEKIQLLHIDLNASKEVFEKFVKPLLQRTEFPNEPDPAPSQVAQRELDFTRIYTGHVAAGGSQEVTIQLDNVTVASFALYEPTRSLTVTVRGATGNVIALDPVRNGLITINDPTTLVYLGYGFTNPRPGPWKITLSATNKTPARGADYAVTAQLRGGAHLNARASKLLPRIDEQVDLVARLELGGQAINIREARALIRDPEGKVETIALTARGAEWQATWKPRIAGLHGVDIQASGTLPDGTALERSAFLSVEAQPSDLQTQITQAIVGGVALLIVVGIAMWIVSRFRRRSK
ncbi:MAG: alpha/beta hydrolase [Chloroflexi bacterium]|nr:alpha/beta hydrolase [Chloroflexota bacterium]